MGGGEKLLAIQAARGIAALTVVVYHGGKMISLPQYVGEIPLGGFFNFGHAGVDFFFVLSGFIIYFVHHRDISRPDALRHYVWRRLTRIYPIYWVVTGLVVLLALFRPGGSGLELGHLAKSVLLLPQDREPVLGVAWTLEHEMLFYIVFALAIVGRRLSTVVLIGWAGLIIAALFATLDDVLLRFLASAYHLQFGMGAAAAYTLVNHSVPVPRLMALVGGLGFLAVGMVENAGLIGWAGLVSKLLFGGTATLIVLGLAAAEQQRLIRVGRAGAFLGAASYSLYLIHVVAIGLMARVLMTMGVIKLIPGWLVLVLVVAAATVASALLHLFVERPVMTRLAQLGRSYVYGPRPSPVTTASP